MTVTQPPLITPFISPFLRNDATIDLDIGCELQQSSHLIKLNESALHSHVAIFGGTRKGKSKLLEMMMRQLLCSRRTGFCLIDPHGDLCEELLGYIGLHWKKIPPSKRDHIYYLNPSQRPFAFDPFLYHEPCDLDGQSPESFYRKWLEAAVDRVAEVFLRQRGEANFQATPRLEKVLRHVLYATGVRLGDSGHHLPLAYAMVLIHRDHGLHDRLFYAVAPRLPADVRSTLERIRRYNDEQFDTYVGSTENQLSSLLRSVVRDLLRGDGDPLDLADVMHRRGTVLVNLAETSTLSKRQADAIGGLILTQLITLARATPVARRSKFHVIIDEAHRFVGHDILDTLGQSSKWGLYFTLAVQDLSALRNADGSMNLLPKVLSQCNVKMTFQQQHIPDAQVLAEAFCYPDLDFTRLVHQQQLHDGYEWIDVESLTEGDTWDASRNWTDSEGWNKSESKSDSDGTTDTEGQEENWSEGSGKTATDGQQRGTQYGENTSVGGADTTFRAAGISQAEIVGRSTIETDTQMTGQSSGEGINAGIGLTPIHVGTQIHYIPIQSGSTGTHSSTQGSQGRSRGEAESHSKAIGQIQNVGQGESRHQMRGDNRSWSDSESQSLAKSESQQHGRGQSHSRAITHQATIGHTDGTTGSHSHGGGESQGGSRSVTKGKTPLAQYRLVDVDTGQLARSVADQMTEKTRLIRTLKQGQLVLSLADTDASIPVEVHYVRDAFDNLSPEFKLAVLKSIKQQLWSAHACFVDPTQSVADPEFEMKRLRAWLDVVAEAVQPERLPVAAPVAAWLPEGCPYDF